MQRLAFIPHVVQSRCDWRRCDFLEFRDFWPLRSNSGKTGVFCEGKGMKALAVYVKEIDEILLQNTTDKIVSSW